MQSVLHVRQSGCFEVIAIADESYSVYFQSDWDYPGLASRLGFIPCKQCNHTDGTVDCEHRKASEMIREAGDYLREHEGECFDADYFE